MFDFADLDATEPRNLTSIAKYRLLILKSKNLLLSHYNVIIILFRSTRYTFYPIISV